MELEAAENAGIDISNHVWLTGEEALSVCSTLIRLFFNPRVLKSILSILAK